jgi:hypothetical protein
MKRLILLTLPLLMLASCQNSLDPSTENFFVDENREVPKTRQFVDLMIVSGARADATLSKQHFDGGKLNSLGEEKLSFMLRDDDAPTPFTVYLNVDDKAPSAKTRQTSVVAFLKDKGLTEQQIDIVFGDNPDSRSPASQHLSRLSKTETGTGTTDSSASKDSSANAQGQGGSSPSGNDSSGLAGAAAAGK